jgi:dTMP kinase
MIIDVDEEEADNGDHCDVDNDGGRKDCPVDLTVEDDNADVGEKEQLMQEQEKANKRDGEAGGEKSLRDILKEMELAERRKREEEEQSTLEMIRMIEEEERQSAEQRRRQREAEDENRAKEFARNMLEEERARAHEEKKQQEEETRKMIEDMLRLEAEEEQRRKHEDEETSAQIAKELQAKEEELKDGTRIYTTSSIELEACRSILLERSHQ